MEQGKVGQFECSVCVCACVFVSACECICVCVGLKGWCNQHHGCSKARLMIFRGKGLWWREKGGRMSIYL